MGFSWVLGSSINETICTRGTGGLHHRCWAFNFVLIRMRKVVVLFGLWSLLSLSHAQLVRSSWVLRYILFTVIPLAIMVHFCYRQIQQRLKVRKRRLTFLLLHAPSWLPQPLILASTCSVSWQHVIPRPASSCPPWVSQQPLHSFQWVWLCFTMEDHTFLTAVI